MKNTSKHTAGKIGVGIIGAAPDRGWALTAHVPALKSLPSYEIRAVSTTRRESAEAAARAFGAEQWFDNHQELVCSPKVDLVAVTVKVPYHFELVTAAIAAGKSVYCEWPLGNGLAKAVEISERARKSGVRGAVGLQARSAPQSRRHVPAHEPAVGNQRNRRRSAIDGADCLRTPFREETTLLSIRKIPFLEVSPYNRTVM